MIEIRKLILFTAMVLALSACRNNEAEEDLAEDAAATPAEVSPAAVPEAPQPPLAEQVAQTVVAADAVTVGTSLQGDDVVKAANALFTTADTVYASASVRGKPAGTDVAVYWTFQDGTSHKEESKKIASGDQQVLWFSFGKADGMRPGKYNVQIDVNSAPVGIADFVVK